MTGTIKLSDATIDRLIKGEAILFLGAGASRMASGPGGLRGLSGNELRDAICDKFLGGTKKDKQLAYIGDLAKSEVGLLEMQRFVCGLFRGLEPTSAHSQVTKFRWKALFTTNYDLLVEKAYAAATSVRHQKLCPLLSDDDDFAGALRDPLGLPYIKLHGDVTRESDSHLPLILSSWEYYRYSTRRTRLFAYLKEWGHDFPVIFCGYEIADENVREVVFDLSDNSISRPRYAFISPSVQDVDTRMWAERRIDASSGTFDDLMHYLDSRVDDRAKTLAFARPSGHKNPLTRFIPSHTQPSDVLASYLDAELTLIHKGMPTSTTTPREFYEGISNHWAWLPMDLDISRSITDELVFEWTRTRSPAAPPISFLLLKGYAGSGKSVALRRAAWTLANEQEAPVFFLREGSYLRVEQIEELFGLLREPLTIFVDNVLSVEHEIRSLLREARKRSLKICIFAAARTNEWNASNTGLASQVTQEFELLDLSDSEIRGLLTKLATHHCLGYLEKLKPADAFAYFKHALAHQLLVGLHQATYGRDLEDIVFEEYANIVPRVAQTLYLDVCSLHRLGVPVRAGLISRVSGVAFNDFREKLLKPLEHVVQVEHYAKVADYVYQSRHQDIAEIVFRKVLVDPVAKSDQLVRIVSCLNINYSIDRQSMLDIIGSRGLAESFADKLLGHKVLDAAKLAGLDLESVEEHRALFETHHPAGDIRAAFSAVERAISASGGRPSRATLHVKAIVLRRLAGLPGISEVERDKRRQEALGILNGLMTDQRDPHPFHVKAELLLDDLQERLDNASDLGDAVTGRQVAELVRDAERTLQQAGQLFIGNSYIATASSRLADILENHPKALSILETAFRQNQQNTFVAIRLARQYRKRRDFPAATEVLRRAVSLNPNNKDVHYMLAQILRLDDEHKNQTEIGQHLRKSFSDGDNRYDARLYFARHQYLYGDRLAARREFEQLAHVPLPPQELSFVQGRIKDSRGDVIMYSGQVTTKRQGYCFVRCHALGDDVFIHGSEFAGGAWDALAVGQIVSFGVGFSLRGIRGTRATV